ncbi:MAG: hypothetical protein IKS85_02120 [Lachnospiraceae bacterium]|nr:hypothetical protein [Lachnospiraceae bacterium]
MYNNRDKKSGIIKALLIIAGVMGGATIAKAALSAKRVFRENDRKAKALQEKDPQLFMSSNMIIFGKSAMQVKETTDIIFATAIFGRMEVDFTSCPIKKETYVDCTAVKGTVILRVPQDAEVLHDGMTFERKQFEDEENESPVIHVTENFEGGKLEIIRG